MDSRLSPTQCSCALLLVIVLVIIAVVYYGRVSEEKSGFAGADMPPGAVFGHARGPLYPEREGMTAGPPTDEVDVPTPYIGDGISASAFDGGDGKENPSIYAAAGRMYSTAEADPLITGQLYAHSDGLRNVYAQRSAHGDGLAEYSSSGNIGDVGVDVGPLGLDAENLRANSSSGYDGYDDGIPEQWAMPSTPVRWYAPRQRDYYGPEGPTAYTEGMYALTEADHDPLTN